MSYEINDAIINLITACGSERYRNSFFNHYDADGNIHNYPTCSDAVGWALDTLHYTIGANAWARLNKATKGKYDISDYEFSQIISEDYNYGLMNLLYQVVLLCRDSDTIALAYAAFKLGKGMTGLSPTESITYRRIIDLRGEIVKECNSMVKSFSDPTDDIIIGEIEKIIKKKGGAK